MQTKGNGHGGGKNEIMRAIGAGDDAAAMHHYQSFITRHVDPEFEQSELPTAADVRRILAGELNAVCDKRKDMAAVKQEDL